MATYTIYHNPRCSKSRQTLALLQEHGVSPQVIEYLKTPPSQDELKELQQKLNLPIAHMLRTKEKEFSQAGLNAPGVSDDIIRKALAEHPILLERPIVTCGDKAVIGRPPENVLALL
jgi:arsenate reductase